MEFLTVINKILDLRIVQYALVVGVLVLSVTAGVQSFRLHLANNATIQAIKERDEAQAAIVLQNMSIENLKVIGEAQVKSMENAINKAKALTVEQEKKTKSLREKLAQLPEKDCQGTVDGFIKLVPQIVGGTP